MIRGSGEGISGLASRRVAGLAARRTAAVLAGGALALGFSGVLAVPAFAEPTPTPTPSSSDGPSASPTPSGEPTQEQLKPYDLKVDLRGTQIPVGSQGKSFYVDVTNAAKADGEPAKDVVVKVQALALDPKVALTGPQPEDDKACKAGEEPPTQPDDPKPSDSGTPEDKKDQTPTESPAPSDSANTENTKDKDKDNPDDKKAPAGKVFTCVVKSLAPGAKKTFAFKYGLGKDQKEHKDAGKVTATVKAKGKDAEEKNNKATANVDIVAATSDLSVSIPDTAKAEAGGKTETYARIGNFGSNSAGDVLFAVAAPDGTTLDSVALKDKTGKYTLKCEIITEKDTAEKKGEKKVGRCDIADLKADKFVTAKVVLNVGKDAKPNTVLTGGKGIAVSVPKPKEGQTPSADPKDAMQEDHAGQKQDEKKQEAEKTPEEKKAPKTDGDPQGDNQDTFGVPVRKPSADLAVSVNETQGTAGEVTLKGQITSGGPSTAKGISLEIVAPTGTGFAERPEGCTDAGKPRALKCSYPAELANGKNIPFAFKMKINATPGDDGSATVTAKTDDPDKKNNSLTYKITGGPADNPDDGGNNDGGNNGGGNNNSGGNNGGNNTGYDNGGNNNGGNSDDGSGDKLPVTGDKSGVIAAVGGGLLLAGALFAMFGRQRRWYVVKY